VQPYRRWLFCIATGIFAGSSTYGSTVFLNSDLHSEFNNLTGTNVAITPVPAVWEPNGGSYFWISYDQTGFGGIAAPNVTGAITLPNPAPPTAIFYEDFTVDGPVTSGGLVVWADDTARVYIDKVGGGQILLIDANPGTGAGYCSGGVIGCLPGEGAFFNLASLNLTPGQYEVEIDAYQRNGGPFGVMYAGFLTTSTPTVPEPATAGMTLLGLGAGGLWLRRRRRAG